MNFGPNEMLMDLFRSEVESHSESLTQALLQLEKDPSDSSVYDSMMRAAHSIKGAARIVQVEEAVEVSHIMEDCFVAAQRGELSIQPASFDSLFKGIDLLVRISEATKEAHAEWDEIRRDVKGTCLELAAVRSGKPAMALAPSLSKSVAYTNAEKNNGAKSESLQANEVALSVAKVTVPSKASVPMKATFPSIDSITKNPNEIARYQVGKHFDQQDAERLRTWFVARVQEGTRSLRVDLSSTIEIDPVGLALLAALKNHASKQKGLSLSFAPLSPEMEVVLRVTGLKSQ